MKNRLSAIAETCHPASVRRKLTECNWHRISVSFWSSFAFIGWGASLVVIGPTLLDLAHHVSVDVGTVSLMFICRAVGSLIGVATTGVILDKLSGYLYTTIFIVLACFSSTMAVIPVSVHIAMLSVFMFFNGMMSGSTVTGLQFTVLKLWGDKSGPANQLLHFCFAFGAFISPLIAKPFISKDTEEVVNTTCQLSNQSAFILDPDATNHSDCSMSYDSNCSLPSNETESNSNFAYAYWSTLSILIPPLLAFLYFAVRHELFQRCIRSSKKTLVNEVMSNGDCDGKERTSDEKSFIKQSLGYRIIILGLLFCFLFLYVGMEVTFGSLIFTVTVTGELCFSKSSAALLQSVFWGAFAFMRFFSVSLALLKVRASVMLIGNLSGSLLASIIMVFYPHNPVAIWIGSAVLGMSYASIYPTTMTWMSENTQVSGISTAVLMCGGAVGVITLPALVGALIAHVTPDSLIYTTFVSVTVSSLLIAVLFTVVSVYKRRTNNSLQNSSVHYNRLPDQDHNATYGDSHEEVYLEENVSESVQCNGSFEHTVEDVHTNRLDI